MSQAYDNMWIFEGLPFFGGNIKSYFGFVYLITDLENGKKYIGRKYFYSRKMVKGKKKKHESDWRQYYSSNETIKALAKENPLRFRREILHLCETQGKCNWLELEEIVKRDMLKTDMSYNDNLLGKYFKKNVIRY